MLRLRHERALLRKLAARVLVCAAATWPMACSHRETVTTYDTGARDVVIEWRGRARDGRYTQYHPNGNVAVETRYRAGLRDGPWLVRHADGKPAVEGTFVAGLREGEWTEWNEKGTKILAGTWHAGEKTGTWSEFDDDGRPSAIEVFENGTRRARLPAEGR